MSVDFRGANYDSGKSLKSGKFWEFQQFYFLIGKYWKKQ